MPFGNGRYVKPIECRCEHNFTCRFCLNRAYQTVPVVFQNANPRPRPKEAPMK